MFGSVAKEHSCGGGFRNAILEERGQVFLDSVRTITWGWAVVCAQIKCYFIISHSYAPDSAVTTLALSLRYNQIP